MNHNGHHHHESFMGTQDGALNNAVITLDRLPKPVLQEKAHPARSDRYVHINTHEVMQQLEKEGFRLQSVQVTKTRHHDPLYARHQVIMRHESLRTKDGVVPQFYFTNAHDGSSSAKIMLGAFRFVCSNGLVVGDTYASERIRHAGNAAADVIERARLMAQSSKPLFETIEAWKAKTLNEAYTRKFAELSAVLRWGDPHRFPPEEVLKVRRMEDDGPSLWQTFNRVQENCMRGGLEGLSGTGRKATSRPLSDIANSSDFNGKLWKLAEDFAAL